MLKLTDFDWRAAVTAGLGGQISETEVIYQAVDIDVPADAEPYAVNIDGGVTEYEDAPGAAIEVGPVFRNRRRCRCSRLAPLGWLYRRRST